MSTQVKPLEWTQKAPPGREHEPFVYWAAGLGGHYSAEPDGLLWMAGDEFTWQQHPTQAAAKAAAQADYEARIRSALHPSPTPVSAPVGMVEELIREAIDLLKEKKHGNPARSPGHNARLMLEDALAALRSPAVVGK